MEKHFKFGHTIKPSITIEDQSSQGLDHLFQIGEARIKMETPSQRSEEHISIDSDQTPQLREKTKEKKVKKEKHKKHHKHKDDKEEKKNNKKEKDKNKKIIDIEDEDVFDEKSIVPFQQKQKGSSLLAIYQRQLQSKNTNGQLQLSQKIGQGLLQIDRIEFPQKQLYYHGVMDKEVPQYKRLPFFQHIIGGKHKKQKDIVQLISKRINQNQTHPFPDQISKHRYHQFQGYGEFQPQPLPYQRPSQTFLPKIRLGQAETFTQSSSEEQWIRVTKDYNSRLNQNPKDIPLWIEFVNIQPSLSNLPSSNRNNVAVIERQLSIIDKALQLNPLQEQLGLLQLNKLQQKQTDTAQLIQKCKSLIQVHPHVGRLWKIYLYLQLSQFTIFSHQYCRKVFEETTKHLKKVIDNCRSAMQLWKIRKAGLELVRHEVLLYKLQGYGQLATGIILALIDFNFFMPDDVIKLTNHEQKVRIFGQYWEDPQTYHLGDLALSYGWNQPTIQSKDTFIGKIPLQSKLNQSNIYQTESILTHQAWRPSHPILDKQIIEEKPESYVLIEDIDFGLQLYTDSQSLVTLIDLLADHLELPTVFSFQGIYSQFSYNRISESLMTLVKGEKCELPCSQFYWWQKYWDPRVSQSILKDGKHVKLQYFRRILQNTKHKIPQMSQTINQYLTFIICCYNHSEQLRSKLDLSQQKVLSLLQSLLAGPELDIGSWCIYIETTYLQKNNIEECIGCYLQLLQSARLSSQTIIFEVIYWLWTFFMRHCPQNVTKILKLYLQLLDNAEEAVIELKEDLIQDQQRRLERYLKEHYSIIQKETNSSQNAIDSIKKLYLPLLLLDCLQNNLLMNLQYLKPQMIEILMTLLIKESFPSTIRHFLCSNLIQRRLIDQDALMKKDAIHRQPYFELIKYWFQTNRKPNVCFLADFELWNHKNLPIWMTLSIFLWQQAQDRQVFQQYFFKAAKSLSFQYALDEIYPKFIILLNKLMLYDSIRQHGQFTQYSLKQLPYCKQLYLLNLQHSLPQPEVLILLKQKNIRLIHPSLANPQ